MAMLEQLLPLARAFCVGHVSKSDGPVSDASKIAVSVVLWPLLDRDCSLHWLALRRFDEVNGEAKQTNKQAPLKYVVVVFEREVAGGGGLPGTRNWIITPLP